MAEKQTRRRGDDPAVKARNKLEEAQKLRIDKWHALLRVFGSGGLGSIAAWRLLTYDAAVLAAAERGAEVIPWYAWIALAVLAFGVATWDQLLKVTRRGGWAP